MAVFVGAYSAVALGSGAHLNPAVTIGLWRRRHHALERGPLYLVGEMVGAFIGAVLVFLHYYPHWAETEDPGLKLAVFSTGPAIRNTAWNLISEVIGTFVLMFGILAIKGVGPEAHLGACLAPGLHPGGLPGLGHRSGSRRYHGLCHQPGP